MSPESMFPQFFSRSLQTRPADPWVFTALSGLFPGGLLEPTAWTQPTERAVEPQVTCPGPLTGAHRDGTAHLRA